MRQPPNLDDFTDMALADLERHRDTIARHERLRDDILSVLLTPDMDGQKLVSYRLASEASGVPYQTLHHKYPNPGV